MTAPEHSCPLGCWERGQRVCPHLVLSESPAPSTAWGSQRSQAQGYRLSPNPSPPPPATGGTAGTGSSGEHTRKALLPPPMWQTRDSSSLGCPGSGRGGTTHGWCPKSRSPPLPAVPGTELLTCAAHVRRGEAAERVAPTGVRVVRHGVDHGLQVLLLLQTGGVRL